MHTIVICTVEWHKNTSSLVDNCKFMLGSESQSGRQPVLGTSRRYLISGWSFNQLVGVSGVQVLEKMHRYRMRGSILKR